jgi:ABC-type histidine transport system ATPase subunit
LALLDVQELGKDYGGLEALKDVSLSVNIGEVLGLVGPYRLRKDLPPEGDKSPEGAPTAGSITIGGLKITECSEKEKVGDFQKPVMFSSYVYFNASYGLKIPGHQG